MFRNIFLFVVITLTAFLFIGPAHAQEWEFVKEKDGIRIYKSDEPGSKLKAFKGESVLNTTLEEIYPLLSDPNHSEWWDDDLSYKEVLEYKPGKVSKYYLVYDVQWPFGNRDLYVESEILYDKQNRKAVVTTNSVDGVIPEKAELVRIARYWQRWTAVEEKKGEVHLLLEGFTDPGGNIPAWLVNAIIDKTPVRLFENLKALVE